MRINLNPLLNINHRELFKSTEQELIVYGGANAGKTYSIADKIILNSIIQKEKKIKAVVIRKTFPSLRNSAMEVLKKRVEEFGLPYKLNKAEWTMKINNMTIYFLSLANQEDYLKLKSMTDIDFIWINEAIELREKDYDECLRRLRGGESFYNQIIIDFNPISKFIWIYDRFFTKHVGHDVKILKYIITDNHPAYLKTENAQKYLSRLASLKETNYSAYQIYFLGEWGELEGVIFNWDVVEKPEIEFDEIFYGGDFGYSVDPTAVVKIYRRADEFWLEELIYKTNLTNIELAREMRRLGIDSFTPIYFDSSEPKSIREIYDCGFNAKPAEKGPDSVRASIDYLKSLKIHIIDGSENLIKEVRSYVWQKDQAGRFIPRPIEFNDHAISAVRYAIWTHCHEPIPAISWV